MVHASIAFPPYVPVLICRKYGATPRFIINHAADGESMPAESSVTARSCVPNGSPLGP